MMFAHKVKIRVIEDLKQVLWRVIYIQELARYATKELAEKGEMGERRPS